jgi:hypothetical protein
MKAEWEMTEKKMQLERETRMGVSKLPELKISPFDGSAGDQIQKYVQVAG